MNKIKIERFSRLGKEVLFIESVHKINSIILNQLKSEFNSFNPDLVLLEGDFDKAKFSNEKQAIKEGLDMGYLSFISKKKKIKVLSNDPSFKETFDFLKRKYDKDFVLLYFFLRQKSFNLYNKLKFSDEKILNNINKSLNLKTSKNAVIKIKKIFENIFNKELTDKDYSDWFNPTKSINIFNQSTRELNNFRDEFMINIIQSSIKKYNRIIILKGEYHFKEHKKGIKKAVRGLSSLEIHQLNKKTFPTAMKVLDNELGEKRARDKNFLLEKFKEFPEFFIGIFLDKELIGVIGGFPREDYLLMSELAIDRRFQKRGFGKLLVKEFDKIAKEKNYSQIKVGAMDDAISFYNSLKDYKPLLLIQYDPKKYVPSEFNLPIIRTGNHGADFVEVRINTTSLNDLEVLRKRFLKANFQYIFVKKII